MKKLMKPFAILLLVTFGCKQPQPAQLISVQDLKLKLEQSDEVLVIDVRTPEEVDQGKIPGAINLNFRDDDFQAQLESLEKDKPVVVYCAAGGRSAKSGKILGELGFQEVYDLDGGFNAWKKNDNGESQSE